MKKINRSKEQIKNQKQANKQTKDKHQVQE
jgi:hypothetical protein